MKLYLKPLIAEIKSATVKKSADGAEEEEELYLVTLQQLLLTQAEYKLLLSKLNTENSFEISL